MALPDTREPNNYEYSAFISYRHHPRDTEVATQLQRALESYRLPKDVAAKYGARKLDRLFRDQDELPVTESLPDTIRQALMKSRVLVVVCTPDTPESTWVTREIELFASYHGRQNIFPVLAAGTSAESIPPFLRSRLQVQSDGTVVKAPTEPLAADMRPEAEKRFDAEKLRLVAAIVGCGYDDLVRRDRIRQRKQVRSVAAFVLALAIATGVFAYGQLQATAKADREAQLAQAQHLVTQSQQLYAQGDRYGAIRAALEAAEKLPASGAEDMAADLHDVLQTALQVQPNEADMWFPAYSIDTNAPIAKYVLSKYGDWLAVLDDDNIVNVYASTTGSKSFTFSFPADIASQFDNHTHIVLSDSGRHLLLATDAGTGYTACLNPYTGEIEWEVDYPQSAIATRYDNESSIVQLAYYDSGSLQVDAGDIERTGFIAGRFVENAPLPLVYVVQDSAVGEDLYSFFLAFDEALLHIDLGTGAIASASSAHRVLHGIDYYQGRVVSVTSDLNSSDPVLFAVEAFDESLQPIWRFDGETHLEILHDQNGIDAIGGDAYIYGFAIEEIPCAVISAGRTLYLLSVENGSIMYSRTFDAPIVGVYRAPSSNNADMLYVARSNGLLSYIDPLKANIPYEGLLMPLNYQQDIRSAKVAFTTRDFFITVAAPAANSQKLIAFRSNFVLPSSIESRDYTLDELVQLAHETLREDGYE